MSYGFQVLDTNGNTKLDNTFPLCVYYTEWNVAYPADTNLFKLESLAGFGMSRADNPIAWISNITSPMSIQIDDTYLNITSHYKASTHTAGWYGKIVLTTKRASATEGYGLALYDAAGTLLYNTGNRIMVVRDLIPVTAGYDGNVNHAACGTTPYYATFACTAYYSGTFLGYLNEAPAAVKVKSISNSSVYVNTAPTFLLLDNIQYSGVAYILVGELL